MPCSSAEEPPLARQRSQRQMGGHRGSRSDPIYGIRRLLLTRHEWRTDRQKARLAAVHDDAAPIGVEVTHGAYEERVGSHANPDRRAAGIAMLKILKRRGSVASEPPPELAQHSRSLSQRRKQTLANFDTAASNGHIEAINGRLEHLPDIALIFRNLTHYSLRKLTRSGQIQERGTTL